MRALGKRRLAARIGVAAAAVGVTLATTATPAFATEYVRGGPLNCGSRWVTTTTYSHGLTYHVVKVGGAYQQQFFNVTSPGPRTKQWNYHYVEDWFLQADLLDEGLSYAYCS